MSHNVKNMLLFIYRIQFFHALSRKASIFHQSSLRLSSACRPSRRPRPCSLLFKQSCSFDSRRALGLITNAVSLKPPLSRSPPTVSSLALTPRPREDLRRGGHLCSGWDHRCHCPHIQVGVTLTDGWRGRSTLRGGFGVSRAAEGGRGWSPAAFNG